MRQAGTGEWLLGLAIVVAAALGVPSSAPAARPANDVIAYSFVEQDPGMCDGCDEKPPARNRSWIELVHPNGTHRSPLWRSLGLPTAVAWPSR